jgi:hypothetical protein
VFEHRRWEKGEGQVTVQWRIENPIAASCNLSLL